MKKFLILSKGTNSFSDREKNCVVGETDKAIPVEGDKSLYTVFSKNATPEIDCSLYCRYKAFLKEQEELKQTHGCENA